MSKLYIFGDSYSTPEFLVSREESWWGLLTSDLANKINKVENFSWPGNNIDSIAHIITSRIDMFNADDYIVVGIPPVPRLTMYNPEKNFMPQKTLLDVNLVEQDREDILCHSGLAQYSVHDMGKEYVSVYDPGWGQAQALRTLLLLNNYMQSKINCKHLVFLNLGEPYQREEYWPTLRYLQEQLPDNMLIFDNTYYSANLNLHVPVDFDSHGWFGHHGPAGNKHWYDVAVRPMLTKFNWL